MDPVTLGMARAATSRALDARVRLPLVPIADRIRPPFNSTGNYPAQPLSNGTNLGGTSRERVVAQCTARGLVVDFSGWINQIIETATPNDVSIRASIELTSTYNMPITFGGKLDGVVQAGTPRLRSDPIGVRVTKGQQFWIRVHVSGLSNGQKYQLMRQSRGGTYGEGFNVDPATAGPGTDMSGYGQGWAPGSNGSLNLRIPGASMVLGHQEKPSASLLVIGDSIPSSTGENYCFGTSAGQSEWLDFGWANRACFGRWPHVVIGMSGTDALGWTTLTGATSYRRRAFVESLYFSHVVNELIINDINGGKTLAQLQAILIAEWVDLAGYGKPVYQCTATPFTSSTDFWTTLSGQSTGMAAGQEAVRVAANDWIRDGSPLNYPAMTAAATGAVGAGVRRAGQAGHPLAAGDQYGKGYIEVADAVESARNSGKWKVFPRSRVITDAAMNAGSPTLTSASAAFTAADVGLHVMVAGVGSGGAVFAAYITAVTSGTTATLAFNAATTASGQTAQIGDRATTMDGIHPSGDYGANSGGHGLMAATVAPQLAVILGPDAT